MGQALAMRWANAGIRVVLVNRTPARTAHLDGRLGPSGAVVDMIANLRTNPKLAPLEPMLVEVASETLGLRVSPAHVRLACAKYATLRAVIRTFRRVLPGAAPLSQG